MNKSVMLAYFAQRPAEYLRYLDVELNEVTDSCYTGEFTVISRPSTRATLDQLRDDINEHRDSIFAFHYSGHADSKRIFLQHEIGSAPGVANLLGKCPNLRFVFLNGCSTVDQVQALFDNGVKIVIATHYNVADIEAYVFSRQFYAQLFKMRSTIIDAFRSAIVDIGTKENLRELLPDSLKGNESSISAVYYRGIGKDIGDKPWGIFTSKEDDPILKSNHLLPYKKLKMQLDRAYTCGRNPIRGIFRQHHQAKVFHFVIADTPKNSPEGLSIKLLFENFTRDHDWSKPITWLYPADPNQDNFKDKVIELYSNDRTEAEIIERIYTRIHNQSDQYPKTERSFSDLYNLPDISLRKQVFIFIRVQESDFERIKSGIREFIESSRTFALKQKEIGPQFLFFWHFSTEDKFLRLRPFRRTVAKLLNGVSNVAFLHEEYLRPLPELAEKDLSEWIAQNEIDPEVGTPREAFEILKSNQDDISLLEVELRAFIKRKRNSNRHG